MPKVLNTRFNTPAYLRPTRESVLVDRTTIWGNPFSRLTREQNIEKFRRYAEERSSFDPYWLKPLVGKDLVCWCAPKPCHADVILELINKIYGEQK